MAGYITGAKCDDCDATGKNLHEGVTLVPEYLVFHTKVAGNWSNSWHCPATAIPTGDRRGRAAGVRPPKSRNLGPSSRKSHMSRVLERTQINSCGDRCSGYCSTLVTFRKPGGMDRKLVAVNYHEG